jgi:hypothetical protein
VPVVVAFVFSGAVFLWVRRRKAARPWYRRIEEDLESSFAKVTTCFVTDAINVEEFEDEGSHYYLLLEDGPVVFPAGRISTSSRRRAGFRAR